MRILLVITLAISLLGACSGKRVSPYQEWSALETPEVFKSKNNWSFILLNREGEINRRIVIRFTEYEAKTCSSGDWKQAEIIDEYPPRQDDFLGESAYFVNGAALIIDLSSNFCDAGYELKGQLQETGVTGNHYPVSMFGIEIVGKFYGVPIKDT